jgi:uridine kinase
MVMGWESVSTWRQPMPAPASDQRTRVIDQIAGWVVQRGGGRLRVAVDGYSAAGKTSFGHELAAAVRSLGRPTLRASLDDFKHPWRHARENGYDRLSGAGFYSNAYDHAAVRDLLLLPAGADGSGRVVLCAHDPLTGKDHRHDVVMAPPDAVLIVDSVFAFRPEYNDLWDYRIWLDIDADLSLARGIARDTEREGLAEVTRVFRDRYHVAEQLYLTEVDPVNVADLAIDNTELRSPHILKHR